MLASNALIGLREGLEASRDHVGRFSLHRGERSELVGAAHRIRPVDDSPADAIGERGDHVLRHVRRERGHVGEREVPTGGGRGDARELGLGVADVRRGHRARRVGSSAKETPQNDKGPTEVDPLKCLEPRLGAEDRT